MRTEILPLATSHVAIARLCNQFNHVFACLISMPFSLPISMLISKALIFIEKGLKSEIKLFLQKKIQNFRALGTLLPVHQNSSPLQIFGNMLEPTYVFAMLISMPPEFSMTPPLKSINFFQNKPKIKLLLQKK